MSLLPDDPHPIYCMSLLPDDPHPIYCRSLLPDDPHPIYCLLLLPDDPHPIYCMSLLPDDPHPIYCLLLLPDDPHPIYCRSLLPDDPHPIYCLLLLPDDPHPIYCMSLLPDDPHPIYCLLLLPDDPHPIYCMSLLPDDPHPIYCMSLLPDDLNLIYCLSLLPDNPHPIHCNYNILEMTLLASHIPVLYCMLYYRSTNSSTHTLRSVLDPDLHISTKAEEISDEASSYGRRSSTDRPWTHHNRKIDLNKVCTSQKGPDLSGVPRVSGHRDPTEQCTLRHPDDIRRMLSAGFLSEGDLHTITSHIEASAFREEQLNKMKYIMRIVARRKKLEPLMAGGCGQCETEIGYEVLSEVNDFKGANFTVVNFNNGYQFIAAGRCVNENAPCGGIGQARCKQIFKAHWTLVWNNDLGVQMVAHEVPSHCECLNLGSATYRESPQVNNRYLDTSVHIVSKP
ncbi:hypothetical protein Btru_004305 [Bulinus truncatus]|nr:hypothetical protein Btru_004305 [Bulinus truncatus]